MSNSKQQQEQINIELMKTAEGIYSNLAINHHLNLF
jgi:hypothetical protein